MTKKTYTVYIEEKLCKGFETQAETMEQAIEKIKDEYRKGNLFLTMDDTGTGPEMMGEDNETGEQTDWFEI